MTSQEDPLPSGSISLIESRVTLAAALAWRAIAELARRHADTHETRVVQFHPGASVRGVIRVRLQYLDDRASSSVANFNLGGPAGTYSIGDVLQTCRSLSGLLMEHPENTIDEIERLMQLPHRSGPVPPSTDRVLGLRLVAELLERRVFDRAPWRASLAAWDWNGGTSINEWYSDLLGEKYASDAYGNLRKDAQARLSDLVLVHRAQQDEMVHASEMIEGSAIAVDLDGGAISRLTPTSTTPMGDCRTLYTRYGRSIHEVVTSLDKHLSAPGS